MATGCGPVGVDLLATTLAIMREILEVVSVGVFCTADEAWTMQLEGGTE